MKPERVVLVVASLLVAAGLVAWAAGGAVALQRWGMWLGLAALGVLAVPLLLWLVDALLRAVRR